MAVIAPSVLATSAADFDKRLITSEFADRIQVDLMDGQFAQPASLDPAQIHWMDGQTVDIHLMYDDPRSEIETLLVMQPSLIIVHAEAMTFVQAFEELGQFNIKRGVALLPQTQPEQVADYLKEADHCLIFGGELGAYGGAADLAQLEKVKSIKSINPEIEVSWDGGANQTNIIQIVEAGVDVVAVGSAIQQAENPQDAYATLVRMVRESGA